MADASAPGLHFGGSIPEVYDTHLVPLIFESYADDLAERLADLDPRSVLEVAAGSGVVTRAMAQRLDGATSITATDLSDAMLDRARAVGTSRPVTWRQADVMSLPFDDDTFDAVVCQFGVMFFPDRPAAFAEVARVLRPGGRFLFNVWDRVENNEFAEVVTQAVTDLFGGDSPTFLVEIPHGYYDEGTIRADLAGGGLNPTSFDAVEVRSRAEVASVPAVAYCQGTPLRTWIEAHDPALVAAATDAATSALEARFGARDLDSKIRAFVVTATAP